MRSLGKFGAVIAAVGASLMAVPLAAQALASPAAVPAATQSDPAEDLITILLDPPSIGRQTVESLEVGFAAALQNDPGIGQIDKRFPGFVDAVKAQVRKDVLAWSPALLARFHDTSIAFLRERLTRAELTDIRDFYRTPVGRRLLESARDGARKSALNMIADNAKTKATAVTSDQMKTATEAAIAGAIGAIQPGDAEELAAFGITSAAQKLAANQGEFNELVRNTINSEVARFTPVLQQNIATFVKAYLAKGGQR